LLDHEQKRREIAESREKLEKLLGVPVRGFRAPGYRIDRVCIALLEQYGYAYDASVLPNQHCAQLEVPITSLAIPQKDFLGTALVELPMPRYRPLPFPFNPSYSLLLGMWYFRLGFRQLVKRKAPMILLFHPADMADPVPREWRIGLKESIFTLSIVTRERKQKYCQAMLDLVRQHYRLLTTSALLTSPRLDCGQAIQGQ
jgi:peptidoglycan/xylan/chitin deacetylase (PgdA/CDA1 family)